MVIKETKTKCFKTETEEMIVNNLEKQKTKLQNKKVSEMVLEKKKSKKKKFRK